MARFEIGRRSFMAGAGALFATGLSDRAAEAVEQTDTLFAATCKKPDGSFAAVLLDEKLDIVREVALPARGHDVTFNPITGDAVIFARRPGNFAVAIDSCGEKKPLTFIAPEGRHFYGHGVFSDDGKLLYTTENDFEAGRGMVGIYDATDRYRRISEYESHGIGPHDILLSPNGRVLTIANGGIETHPDFGRAKLNLATMRPNIAYIDRETGALLEKHELPSAHHHLSIRHMAMDPRGNVVFGCQYQGEKSDQPPLIGKSTMGVGISTWHSLRDSICQGQTYIGSVAITSNGEAAAVSAPRDNAYAIISVSDGRLLRTERMTGVCGLTSGPNGFVASSDQGHCTSLHRGNALPRHDLAFDNHMASLHTNRRMAQRHG